MPDNKEPVDGDAGTTGDGGEGDGAQSQGEAPKAITLTQEELDAIVANRLKRAQPKDYDALKAKAEKYDAAEAAKRTAEEQAQADKTAAESAAAARTAKADAKLIRAALIAEATAQKAADPDIIVALLRDSDTITVDDDGEVDGAKEAVKALLKLKPTLVTKTAGDKSGGEFGGLDPATIDEQIAAAEREGKWAEARDLKIAKAVGAK
jgi:hypothetical protein